MSQCHWQFSHYRLIWQKFHSWGPWIRLWWQQRRQAQWGGGLQTIWNMLTTPSSKRSPVFLQVTLSLHCSDNIYVLRTAFAKSVVSKAQVKGVQSGQRGELWDVTPGVCTALLASWGKALSCFTPRWCSLPSSTCAVLGTTILEGCKTIREHPNEGYKDG